LLCVAIVGLGAAAVGGATTYAVQNPPNIDINIDFAQKDKTKLAGLREALRDHLKRRASEAPEADIQNHWGGTQRSIEDQIRTLLRRHPHWREPGDPRLLIPGIPADDGK
jgi:hypothetical protein